MYVLLAGRFILMYGNICVLHFFNENTTIHVHMDNAMHRSALVKIIMYIVNMYIEDRAP